MPSRALRQWQTRSRKVLDEMEAAHEVVGGGRGARSFARQQIAQAYVVLLASQFQRYCRDLHSEAMDHIASQPTFRVLKPVLSASLIVARRLDAGNANPANIAADYGRFGFRIWDHLHLHDARTGSRRNRLEELNRWRNAVAHQDFSNRALEGRDTLTITEVRRWRRTCSSLAVDFDRVVGLYLQSLTGVRPW